jgi:hypothetical protein
MFKLIYSEFLFGNYKLEQIADRDKSDHLGVVVANLNRVRDQGAPLFEAVLLGAGERLRPVLMTASVATVRHSRPASAAMCSAIWRLLLPEVSSRLLC